MSASLQQIVSFLEELDTIIHVNQPVKLYLIGGAAITLAFDHKNRTADLDLIDPPDILMKHGGQKSALAEKYHVYVSSLAEINFSAPKDWREKSTLLSLTLENLQIFVPCLEDIILGKMARLEPKDFEDILSLHEEKLLDPERLLNRLKENKTELLELTYRNNAKLLFQEVFGRELLFRKGTLSLKLLPKRRNLF